MVRQTTPKNETKEGSAKMAGKDRKKQDDRSRKQDDERQAPGRRGRSQDR